MQAYGARQGEARTHLLALCNDVSCAFNMMLAIAHFFFCFSTLRNNGEESAIATTPHKAFHHYITTSMNGDTTESWDWTIKESFFF